MEMNENLDFPLWIKKTNLKHLMQPAESKDSDFIKDDKGEIILMKYIGPKSKHTDNLWVVTHDKNTSVHPAEKYAHQRYSEKLCINSEECKNERI
jgi:hypothetical protein